MYDSGEIRWFFRGEAPTDVDIWFKDGTLGKSEKPRTDKYLCLPRCETTSVKVREGKLEVKALIESPEPITYANRVTGLRDAWLKWSRKASDKNAFQELITDPDDDWIFVNKRRYLRKFSLDTRAIKEVDAAKGKKEGGPNQGCQVELTAIRAVVGEQNDPSITDATWTRSSPWWKRSSPWWSLSLEAFGDASSVLKHLDRVANHVFRQLPPIDLVEDSSLSYPAWLAGIIERNR